MFYFVLICISFFFCVITNELQANKVVFASGISSQEVDSFLGMSSQPDEFQKCNLCSYFWPFRHLFSPQVSALEVIRFDPFNAETPASALVSQTTSSENAYVRTNFDIPVLTEAHVIEVGGAVSRPLTLTVEALRKMPQRSVKATMECAGNDRLGMRPVPAGEPWQHGAVSTIVWTGVSLAEVLAMAGVLHDGVEVLVTAADAGTRDDAVGKVRFARSLPIKVALHEDTLLALEMNGAPLTREHGFPVRLAVPGWYGMASVKWITRIDVLTDSFNGYFQQQRYVYDDEDGVRPVDHIRVKSIITSPVEGGKITTRKVEVSGWAWSGDGPITRVEVGFEGDNWQEAKLGVSEGPHAWTPWSLNIHLPYAGRFVLRSRATDASGAVQPDQIVWNRLGYGNNAIRYVLIEAD